MVVTKLSASIPARDEDPTVVEVGCSTVAAIAQSEQSPGAVHIDFADALSRYDAWPQPTVIVSDGAYGVNGFPGDPPTAAGLGEWYEPHVTAWSRRALPETTLWFWGTEIGWATVHPVLERHGWEYRTLHIWNKDVAHIAGNVNGKTIRRFPVVTEVCSQYVRGVRLPTLDGRELPMPDWLRHEWGRTGLPFSRTNEACGVRNAATRKYFTKDHLWYYPPPEMVSRLAVYANLHGRPTHWPYFSLNGERPVSSEEWSRLRAKWNHIHGITNVWSEPAVRGTERLKENGLKVLHANQKPVKLMDRIIRSSSDRGDVVWEPFGGLCTGAIASLRAGRVCYSAELSLDFYTLAKARLERELRRVTQAPIDSLSCLDVGR